MWDKKVFSYPYGFLSRRWNSDRAIQDEADYKNSDADFWDSDHQNFPDEHQNSATELAHVRKCEQATPLTVNSGNYS